MSEDELKFIPPSVSQMVERSLAYYTNQQGIQKYFYLLEATENLRQFIIVNHGEEDAKKLINDNLSSFSYNKIKNYIHLDKKISLIRTKFNEAQVIYDLEKKKGIKSQGYERKISRKISPYQVELHFLFHVLLKISGLQNKVISKEYLRSPEEGIFSQTPFDKKRTK